MKPRRTFSRLLPIFATLVWPTPLEAAQYRTGDVEIEQELSRPYAYVSSRMEEAGFDHPNPESHRRRQRIQFRRGRLPR